MPSTSIPYLRGELPAMDYRDVAQIDHNLLGSNSAPSHAVGDQQHQQFGDEQCGRQQQCQQPHTYPRDHT